MRPISPRFLGRRFFAVFALLATIAQIVVAAAPLAEGRDGRMASHVEANGQAAHFAHNDATCAACQVRTIHGTTSASPAALPVVHLASTIRVAGTLVVVSADRYPRENPRAPPSVI